jgi:hypothetical protein
MTSRAMAARSGETGTGSTEGNSAVANGDGPQPTDNAETIMTDVQQAVPVAGEGGQDRKFAFRDGQFVNRVSGEPIPLDEPVIIFRARDNHSLPVLREYLSMASDPHHRQAIKDRMGEFAAWRSEHPDRVKEPGITHHIRLNERLTEPARKADRLGEGNPGVCPVNEAIRRAREYADKVYGVAWRNLEEVSRVELILNELDRPAPDPTHTREAELRSALELVRMSRGWQYLADETRQIIDAALSAGSAQ